jgi:hypothetical protein
MVRSASIFICFLLFPLGSLGIASWGHGSGEVSRTQSEKQAAIITTDKAIVTGAGFVHPAIREKTQVDSQGTTAATQQENNMEAFSLVQNEAAVHQQAHCTDDSNRRRSNDKCSDFNLNKKKCYGKSHSGSFWDQEIATTCCGSCQELVSTTIKFKKPHGASYHGDYFFPEELRFERCHSASSCEPCSGAHNCFHFDNWGNVDVEVDTSAPFAIYKATLVAKCKAGINAKWMTRAGSSKIKAGRVDMYVDGVKAHTLLEDIPGQQIKEWAVPQGNASTLQVQFIPELINPSAMQSGSSTVPSANLDLTINQADVKFEDCLESIACLKEFSDATDASMAIRSDNGIQFACLLGHNMTSADLQFACNSWVACLAAGSNATNSSATLPVSSNPSTLPVEEALPEFQQLKEALPEFQQFYVTLMNAAGVTPSSGGSLLQKHVGKDLGKEGSRTGECFDPTTGDLEALDCDCKEIMIAKCGVDNQTCYHEHLCSNENICQTWKDVQSPPCPPSLLQNFQKRQLITDRNVKESSTSSSASLNEASIGKCGA